MCSNCDFHLEFGPRINGVKRIPAYAKRQRQISLQNNSILLLSSKENAMFARAACRVMFGKLMIDCAGLVKQLKEAFKPADIVHILSYGLSIVEIYNGCHETFAEGPTAVQFINRIVFGTLKFPHICADIWNLQVKDERGKKFEAWVEKTHFPNHLKVAAKMMNFVNEEYVYDVLRSLYQLTQQNGYAKALFTNIIFHGIQAHFAITTDIENEKTICAFLLKFFPKTECANNNNTCNNVFFSGLPSHINGYLLTFCDFNDVWNLAFTSKPMFFVCNDWGKPSWKEKNESNARKNEFIFRFYKSRGGSPHTLQLGELPTQLSKQTEELDLYNKSDKYKITKETIATIFDKSLINCSHFQWDKVTSFVEIWKLQNLRRFEQASKFIKANEHIYFTNKQYSHSFDAKVSFLCFVSF